MNRNRSFQRKIVYGAIIALLAFPLFYLGQPATPKEQGGVLAQMRRRHNLAQATLGDIDPASETMKLVTLGLRPVAWIALMERQNTYKKKEDWDSLAVTLNQLTKLDPNIVQVWEFQAHNLSYNVSVEFDDYRHRYLWVTKGIDFLVRGTQYNRNEPKLDRYVGWYMGHKIGKSDEQRQFRRLFRTDNDFHLALNQNGGVTVEQPDAQGPDGRPDNWLVGRQWFVKAEEGVKQGRTLRGMSPLLFYADGPMARISYATAIEEEGVLDEKARIAWEKAGVDWRLYGDLTIPHSTGHTLRLNDLDGLLKNQTELNAKLDEAVPGAREALRQQKRSLLTDEQRKAIDTPEAERTPAQQMAVFETLQKMFISPLEIAAKSSDANRARARDIAERLYQLEEIQLAHTRAYRQQVNFEYWGMRCELEQTTEAVDARRFLFEAKQFMDAADPESAKKSFEKSFDNWAMLMERFPAIEDDISFTELGKDIALYNQVLGQLDLKLPADFKLRRMYERHLERSGLPREVFGPPSQKPAEKPAEKPMDDKPATEKPAAERPVTEKPAAEKPATEKPEAGKPAEKPVEKPADGKPTAEKPAEKPAEAKPADEKPAEKPVEKPADDKPAAEKPAEKPAEEKPAAK